MNKTEKQTMLEEYKSSLVFENRFLEDKMGRDEFVAWVSLSKLVNKVDNVTVDVKLKFKRKIDFMCDEDEECEECQYLQGNVKNTDEYRKVTNSIMIEISKGDVDEKIFKDTKLVHSDVTMEADCFGNPGYLYFWMNVNMEFIYDFLTKLKFSKVFNEFILYDPKTIIHETQPCCVCMDKTTSKTHCGHYLCMVCEYNDINTLTSCPLCRSRI